MVIINCSDVKSPLLVQMYTRYFGKSVKYDQKMNTRGKITVKTIREMVLLRQGLVTHIKHIRKHIVLILSGKPNQKRSRWLKYWWFKILMMFINNIHKNQNVRCMWNVDPNMSNKENPFVLDSWIFIIPRPEFRIWRLCQYKNSGRKGKCQQNGLWMNIKWIISTLWSKKQWTSLSTGTTNYMYN